MLLFLNLLVNPMFPVQNCYQALAYGLFLILIIPTVADKTQWGMSEYTSLQANVDNTIKYPITITEVYCLIPFLKHGWKERAFAGTPFYINDLFNSYFKMAVTKEITANSWFYWVIIGL